MHCKPYLSNIMATISKEDGESILRIIDYDNMPLFSSKIVAHINASWESVETYDAFCADLVCKVTKNLTGPTFAVKAVADVFHVHSGPGAKSALEQVDAHFFGASAGVSASATHVEANAKATLSGGEVSVFNWHLGAGVSTGGGIKDDSVSMKVAGCGVQIGRKVGISVFDNELAIDFGKLF